MFLRQLQLIIAALTCSLSVICSYLYQAILLDGFAILGLIWSVFACYKIYSFNSTSHLPAKRSVSGEELTEPQTETLSPKQPEMFQGNQKSPHNINNEPHVAFKKEPKISKNLK